MQIGELQGQKVRQARRSLLSACDSNQPRQAAAQIRGVQQNKLGVVNVVEREVKAVLAVYRDRVKLND